MAARDGEIKRELVDLRQLEVFPNQPPSGTPTNLNRVLGYSPQDQHFLRGLEISLEGHRVDQFSQLDKLVQKHRQLPKIG